MLVLNFKQIRSPHSRNERDSKKYNNAKFQYAKIEQRRKFLGLRLCLRGSQFKALIWTLAEEWSQTAPSASTKAGTTGAKKALEFCRQHNDKNEIRSSFVFYRCALWTQHCFLSCSDLQPRNYGPGAPIWSVLLPHAWYHALVDSMLGIATWFIFKFTSVRSKRNRRRCDSCHCLLTGSPV